MHRHPMPITILLSDWLRMAQRMTIVRMAQQELLLVVLEEMILEAHLKNFILRCMISHPMPKIVTEIMVEKDLSSLETSFWMNPGMVVHLILMMMWIQFGALMQRVLVRIPSMVLEILV